MDHYNDLTVIKTHGCLVELLFLDFELELYSSGLGLVGDDDHDDSQ